MNLKECTAIISSNLWEQHINDFINHLNTGEAPNDHVLWHSLSLEMIVNGHVIIPVDDGSHKQFDDIDELVDYLMMDDYVEEDLDEVESFIAAHCSPVE